MFLFIIHSGAFKKIAVLYKWPEGAMFAGDISNLDELPMFPTILSWPKSPDCWMNMSTSF